MADRPETPLARVLREEGRKQSWLAERTGIHPTQLHYIVHGAHTDDAKRAAICEALARDEAELFPDEAVPA